MQQALEHQVNETRKVGCFEANAWIKVVVPKDHAFGNNGTAWRRNILTLYAHQQELGAKIGQGVRNGGYNEEEEEGEEQEAKMMR